MRLYLAKVTVEVMIASSDAPSDFAVTTFAAKELRSNHIYTKLNIREITAKAQIPTAWRDSIPWGNARSMKSTEEILEAQKNEGPCPLRRKSRS